MLNFLILEILSIPKLNHYYILFINYNSSGRFETVGLVLSIESFVTNYLLILVFVQLYATREFTGPTLLVVLLFSSFYYSALDIIQLPFALFFIDASVGVGTLEHFTCQSMYALQHPSDCRCLCDSVQSAVNIVNNTLKIFRALLIFFLNHPQKFIYKSYRYILYFNFYLIRTYFNTTADCYVLFGKHRILLKNSNTLVLRSVFFIYTNLCRYRLQNIIVIKIRYTSHKAVQCFDTIISQVLHDIDVTCSKFRYIVYIFQVGLGFYNNYFVTHLQWLR